MPKIIDWGQNVPPYTHSYITDKNPPRTLKQMREDSIRRAYNLRELRDPESVEIVKRKLYNHYHKKGQVDGD